MPRPFLIDTDAGSDDAVAVLMALRHPDVDVRAISVVAGNVPLAQGVKNARFFAELCGSDAPVYGGASRPLIRELAPADWFHGADGLGDWGERFAPQHAPAQAGHAVEAIIETVRQRPGIVVVTLGPLTNLAMAVRQAPDIAAQVSRCVVMGGAACTNGNVTPAAEYNIWCDPEAAQIVFRSGLPVEMVGWEFSQGDFALSLDDIEDIRRLNTAYADFAIDSNRKGMRGYEIQTGEIGISLPDGVAMAVAIDPTICKSKSRHYVDIECRSELTRGMTVVDRLNLADDGRNADTWREVLNGKARPLVCWELDAGGWKNLLYELLK